MLGRGENIIYFLRTRFWHRMTTPLPSGHSNGDSLRKKAAIKSGTV